MTTLTPIGVGPHIAGVSKSPKTGLDNSGTIPLAPFVPPRGC